MGLSVDEARLSEFAKSVELSATRFLEGWHASPRSGAGIEFHSSRAYTEGEDARRVDWKRYAATDRLYIKNFEQEHKSRWTIWIDGSQSMNFGGKKRYASELAGSLVFLSRIWGDPWRLAGKNDQSIENAFDTLSRGLGGSGLEALVDEKVRDSYVVLLSDYFFDLNHLEKTLEILSEGRNIILVVQTLDLEELTFSYQDVLEFHDMESPSKLLLDARTVRSRYLEELLSHRKQLESLQRENQVFFHCFEATGSKITEHLMSLLEDL